MAISVLPITARVFPSQGTEIRAFGFVIEASAPMGGSRWLAIFLSAA
jgi:hypothetical protein